MFYNNRGIISRTSEIIIRSVYMSKVLIIGGVAGGATTAARLRRLDEKAEIILFERGEHISYANCGLPYYIGDTIPEREKLFVQTPQAFSTRFKIDVRVNSEVTAINKDEKSITVSGPDGESYTESYDKLVLSPGAEPIKPPIPGINSANIFTLRNVSDTDKIKSFINEKRPKRAVVVGAGFIGLEMAENLHHLGMFVTIVEMADQLMPLCDYELATEIHNHMKNQGVAFYLNDGVAAFNDKDGSSTTVILNSKKEIEADLIILSIGVRPDSKLAVDAGLGVGERKAITVDEHMRTSDKNIYALGDAIEFPSPIIGKSMPTFLAGPANKQGRIVANNIVFGDKQSYKGSIGTAIAKIFDITIGSTGLPEKFIKKENIEYDTIIIHASSHAGYYPNAVPMTVKVNFSKDGGKLLGAQIVGFEGVDKRIDMIATVLRNKGTIYDLQEIEHAYAPPYSSAKDPVNIAGFAAQNALEGLVKTTSCFDILRRDQDDDALLLDVRKPEEVELGTIEGSVNIQLDELRDRLDEIPKGKKIIIFCAAGLRGYLAARILTQNGFEDVYNLSGGYKTYELLTHKQSHEIVGQDDHIYQAAVPGSAAESASKKVVSVDACGLQCPGPIMKLKTSIAEIDPGERIEVNATDQGFLKDVQSWCNLTGHTLISLEQEKGKIVALIEKGVPLPQQTGGSNVNRASNKTLIVFSDDFDRALASFVIANGASSTGKQVTMFFTFWGLNVIKKPKKPSVKKDFLGGMFGFMMPGSSKELKLSKMNMNGMGTSMMRGRMKAKNIDSLETMIESAVQNGVKLIACQMSMDMMGVSKEELIDGVEIGGVANYLEHAEESNLNLFV